MIGKKSAFLLLMLSLFASLLYGRDPDEEAPASAVEDAESGPDDGLETAAEEPPQTLYEKTLIKDIDTAGYYELVAWLRSLGLSDQGSIETLRGTLYSYYAIQKESEEPQRGSIITIKSAKDTDYFTIEETDHQMIRLTGDVLVEMEESDSNRRHIIKADQLFFNQTENTLTAVGNLEYRLISGDNEDLFFGDSLTFSVSSWNGVIFKGSSLRKNDIDGEIHTFYFNGEMIRKSGSGGIFILEDGTVKTQDVENPDFHLDAQRLWLMGPKEWGLRHGLLYIGHVPVLYIPFYYKPGNEMFFNPVIGSKQREGNFIQTTTYLIGRKDPSENLSFFQLGDTDEENYSLVREGLYLMKVNTPPEKPETKDTLKVMADWYSRLGAFSGLEGGFYEKGTLNDLEFSAGIGVSRTISDTNSIFFYEDTEYREDWNSTIWGSAEYPFRWGQSLDFNTPHLTGSFQFYSDPFFNQDFKDREESFDWLNTLLTNDMSEEDAPDVVTDMNWTLTYSRVFTPEFASPFIESINLSTLRLQADWNRKENQSESLIYANDPAREFFYPETVNLPFLQVSIKGTPLSYSTLDGWGWKEKEMIQPEEETGPLIPPWGLDETEEEEDSPEEEGSVKPGEIWAPRFTDYTREFYKNSLTYEVTSLANLESTTEHEQWDSPDDLHFDMDESLYLTNNTFKTELDNQFFDNTFGLVNGNELSLNYRTHLDTLGADTDTLEYSDLLSDYQYRTVNWDNSLEAYYFPLKFSDPFAASKWSYNLDNLLYERTLDSYTEGQDPIYKEEWAAWEEDRIDRHSTGMEVRYQPDYYYLTTSALFDLPPLDRKETYTNTAGLDIFDWKSSLSQTIILQEEEWVFNPLVFKTSYEPLERLRLEQDLEYSFEEDTLSKSRSYVKAWGYYAEYTAEYTTPYEWDAVERSWISEEEKAFVPSEFSTGYVWDFDKTPFWKNRISYSTDLTLDWTVNLQQYTNNALSFTWDYKINIFQFLDLKFSMTSSNNSMYLYFPYYREKLGIDREYNFFEDLFRSFNVFSADQEERYASFFNLEKINLSLVHHLREWDLTLTYAGVPNLEENQYEWKSEFSVFLQWNPIPQIQSLIQYEEKEWLVDTQ